MRFIQNVRSNLAVHSAQQQCWTKQHLQNKYWDPASLPPKWWIGGSNAGICNLWIEALVELIIFCDLVQQTVRDGWCQTAILLSLPIRPPHSWSMTHRPLPRSREIRQEGTISSRKTSSEKRCATHQLTKGDSFHKPSTSRRYGLRNMSRKHVQTPICIWKSPPFQNAPNLAPSF